MAVTSVISNITTPQKNIVNESGKNSALSIVKISEIRNSKYLFMMYIHKVIKLSDFSKLSNGALI